jgi:hypothetical protein
VNTRIIIGIVVLVGLGVAVTTTLRSRESKTVVEKPKATLTAPKKEEISEVEIVRPKQAPIVLSKQGDKWQLSAPVQAAADQSAVDSVLARLSDLTVTGVAATRKENHERLEVDAEHAIHVKAKAGDKPVLDLYIGSSKSGGTMVRGEGEQQVLSAKGSFRYVFDKEPKEFRKREVTEVDTAEVTALSVSSQKGAFKFVKQGDAWAQAPGEKPIAKFEPSQVQTLASTAANLRANDFGSPTDASDVTGLDAPRSKVALTKKDGSTVQIEVGKPNAKGDDYYVATNTSEVVYLVAKFSAERLMPDAKFFEKPPAPPPSAQPQMPQGMPGMPAMGGPGGQITPEMMEQIQKQLQAQGGHP